MFRCCLYKANVAVLAAAVGGKRFIDIFNDIFQSLFTLGYYFPGAFENWGGRTVIVSECNRCDVVVGMTEIENITNVRTLEAINRLIVGLRWRGCLLGCT
jgi:hypothetical protein